MARRAKNGLGFPQFQCEKGVEASNLVKTWLTSEEETPKRALGWPQEGGGEWGILDVEILFRLKWKLRRSRQEIKVLSLTGTEPCCLPGPCKLLTGSR